MNNALFSGALNYAMVKHKDQRRKYTGELYLYHLLDVATIVSQYLVDYPQGMHLKMLTVALLHDVMEDQGVTHQELVIQFGRDVADGVLLLSDLDGGNRKQRNEATLKRLADAPGWVQTVKCGDLISNTKSIVEHDPGFAIPYLHEKRRLLAVMQGAHPEIHERATELAVCPECSNTQIIKRWWKVSPCRCTKTWS